MEEVKKDEKTETITIEKAISLMSYRITKLEIKLREVEEELKKKDALIIKNDNIGI
jgi:hypothetical protein